jgi:regulator of sigma D
LSFCCSLADIFSVSYIFIFERIFRENKGEYSENKGIERLEPFYSWLGTVRQTGWVDFRDKPADLCFAVSQDALPYVP